MLLLRTIHFYLKQRAACSLADKIRMYSIFDCCLFVIMSVYYSKLRKRSFYEHAFM